MTYPSKILLAIVFLCPCSSLGINPNDPPSPLLKQVCSQTNTPDFCISALGADPHAANADLKGLTYNSLELSLSSAKENNDFISAMLKSTQDPDVKRGLQHCIVNHGGSVYTLQPQIVDLDNFKYKEARELAGIALESTRDFERAFIQGLTHSSPLTTRNGKLEKLSDVSDVIIGLLLRSVDL